MFQSLASYLLGSSNQRQAEPTNGVETHNTRLTSVVSEDDWVLVDRDSEGNSDVSSVESFDIEAESLEDEDLPSCPVLTRSSSTLSLPCTTNMEESWFLTPPPCFTSAGPVHMATSPLENLLIEHPSMSVYQHPFHSRRLISGVTIRTASPSYADSEEVIDLRVDEIEQEDGQQLTVVQRAPRNNRLQSLQQDERQCLKNKQAQKVRIQHACATLKRNYLERNNKAREVNSRNRRLRRGERSQGATRSYANNNRKC